LEIMLKHFRKAFWYREWTEISKFDWLIDWLIDWCLTPTLAVFQLYRGTIFFFINLRSKFGKMTWGSEIHKYKLVTKLLTSGNGTLWSFPVPRGNILIYWHCLHLNQSEAVLLTNFGNQQTTVSKQKWTKLLRQ
jgi:hypothetical protein